MSDRAGLLVRRGDERLFIPASVARNLVPEPRLSRLPWDDVHMALVGGVVVAVLEFGDSSGVLLLCEMFGEQLALSGLIPERAGFWPASAGGVRVGLEHVPELDLVTALSELRARRAQPESASA